MRLNLRLLLAKILLVNTEISFILVFFFAD